MKQKLNIFSFDYPPNTGGIARMMFEISRSMRKYTSITVLSTESGQVPKGCKIKYFIGPNLFRYANAWRHLLVYGKETPIICSRWYPEGLIACLAGARRYYIMTHGAEVLTAPGTKGKLLDFLKRIVFKRARRVISNSNFTDSLVNDFESKTKTEVLTLAVDPDYFKPVDPTDFIAKHNIKGFTVMSSVSRLQRHKGHFYVLETLSKLPKKKLQKVKYLIAGTGDYRSQIEDKIVQLGLEEHVRLLGFLPEESLNELYSASDLFLLCSEELLAERKVEGFGLVLLEARSCGTPVCGTNSGGIPDAVNKTVSSSYLVEFGDYRQLSAVITSCILNDIQYQTAKTMTRDSVLKNDSWEHYSKALNQILFN